MEMGLNPDQHRLTEQEHRAIFDDKIKPALFADANPSERPVAFIFGGQPGSGKNAAIDAAKHDLAARGGAVEIIGDDLRDFHPYYAHLMLRDDTTAAFYTDRDSGRWIEMAIEEARARRINIVIEGTMRDADKVAATMQSLRAAGFEIDARALAVNPRLSEQCILQRYEAQKHDRGIGRMTTPKAHQAALDGMLTTLERIERDKLADRVTLCRRGGEVIYSNELRNGEWIREPRARAVVEAERNRAMTLDELRDYVRAFDDLAAMLARPERKASTEEVHRLDDLRRQAQDEFAASLQ